MASRAKRTTHKITVPRFASADDERAWWERHATEAEGTDLDRNPFAGRGAKVAYSLRLDLADVERLEKEAARRGVRPTQLARDLIVAGLAADDASDPTEVADMLKFLERKVRAMASTQPPRRKANKRGGSVLARKAQATQQPERKVNKRGTSAEHG